MNYLAWICFNHLFPWYAVWDGGKEVIFVNKCVGYRSWQLCIQSSSYLQWFFFLSVIVTKNNSLWPCVHTPHCMPGKDFLWLALRPLIIDNNSVGDSEEDNNMVVKCKDSWDGVSSNLCSLATLVNVGKSGKHIACRAPVTCVLSEDNSCCLAFSVYRYQVLCKHFKNYLLQSSQLPYTTQLLYTTIQLMKLRHRAAPVTAQGHKTASQGARRSRTRSLLLMIGYNNLPTSYFVVKIP